MNRPAISIILALALPCVAAATGQLRDVQTELKTQGFYYGDLNGENSSETVAAIRRYQIRNGLEVTGSLTTETLSALGIRGTAVREQPPKAPPSQPPRPRATPPPNDTVGGNDRDFLRREEGVRPVPPPRFDPPEAAPQIPPAADFQTLFANTPYASAPREVQESTLRRAQSVLTSRGFYRGVIDGLPGPGTESALFFYQKNARLRPSGMLDLETLGSMRLLPGRAPIPVRGVVREVPGGQRVYRGIIVR